MRWKKSILGMTLSVGIAAGMLYPAESVKAEGESMGREENIDFDSSDQAKEKAYHGNDLGAVYSAEGTAFRVWAPSASQVTLRRYSVGSDTEDGASVLEELDMEKDIEQNCEWNGVWKVTVSGDIADTYYTYLVNVDGKIKETSCIYGEKHDCECRGETGYRGKLSERAGSKLCAAVACF